MARLKERLPLPGRRAEMIDACCRLLQAEVERKRGISGLAVKAGYKVLGALKPGAVRQAVDALFDDFLEALESFHQDYQQAGEKPSLGAYIKTRAAEVAEALVGVSDRRAEQSRHTSLKKAYQKLRRSATSNVEQAVPGLADLLDLYYCRE